jgi:hypothetical protein
MEPCTDEPSDSLFAPRLYRAASPFDRVPWFEFPGELRAACREQPRGLRDRWQAPRDPQSRRRRRCQAGAAPAIPSRSTSARSHCRNASTFGRPAVASGQTT